MTSTKLNKIRRDVAEQFWIISKSITHEINLHVLKNPYIYWTFIKVPLLSGSGLFSSKRKLSSLSFSSLHLVEDFMILSHKDKKIRRSLLAWKQILLKLNRQFLDVSLLYWSIISKIFWWSLISCLTWETSNDWKFIFKTFTTTMYLKGNKRYKIGLGI